MADTPVAPTFVWELFRQLQRRRFPLGVRDYESLRDALVLGFGWRSSDDLRELVVALWAKSKTDAEIVRLLFDRVCDERQIDWAMPALPAASGTVVQPIGPGVTPSETVTRPLGVERQAESAFETQPVYGLAGLPAPASRARRRFVFVPQLPVTSREVAQVWRGLRRPRRIGPATELDVAATVAQRLASGVAGPPVLVPRRRNTARVVLLVDRQGSMAPFHRFVDEVRMGIAAAGWSEPVATYFFHDTPAEGANRQVLAELSGLFPKLDPILSEISSLERGQVYADPDRLDAVPLATVLNALTPATAVAIISDAGAARGDLDIGRVLDSVAFVKALRRRTTAVAWLNPIQTG